MNTRVFEASDGWIRVVPRGFSWSAFFLGPFWAFANRGWVLGILLTLAGFPIRVIQDVGQGGGAAFGALSAISSFAFFFLIGRYGRKWLAWSLKKQGYKELHEHVA